ncbi:hypothetical protein [Streptacidiphilus sp. EB129]|uniref:hypothetical protein n=1 Tax=Streptacidiphilus sp. EB129 TaxID=3156262 RepID=UPI0035174FD7
MDMFDKQDTPSTDARLAAIEEKLDAIMAHLGLTGSQPPVASWGPPDASAMPEVMEWITRGKLIMAIKRYREITGSGLRDAKEAVDLAAGAYRRSIR